jgi:hypothetical protein
MVKAANIEEDAEDEKAVESSKAGAEDLLCAEKVSEREGEGGELGGRTSTKVNTVCPRVGAIATTIVISPPVNPYVVKKLLRQDECQRVQGRRAAP